MKNVFFSLAFMLIGSFAFANTEINSDICVNKIESLINADNLINVDNLNLQIEDSEALVSSFTINFDDGIVNSDCPWGVLARFIILIITVLGRDIFGMINSLFLGFTSVIIRF